LRKSKPLYGRGIVIDTYDQPAELRDRPTTVAILTADTELPGWLFPAFQDAYEEGSKLHRVLGGKINDDNTSEIVLAYAGTKGRDEDMGQIRARLASTVLTQLLLPAHVTYTLRYWLDPERTAE